MKKLNLTKQDIERLYNESKEWRYNFNLITIEVLRKDIYKLKWNDMVEVKICWYKILLT